MNNPEEINKLTQQVIGFAIKIHKHLGPGLLENRYKQCLLHELRKSGVKCEAEKKLNWSMMAIRLIVVIGLIL